MSCQAAGPRYAGGRHGAEPHRWRRTSGHPAEVRRAMRQPGAARRTRCSSPTRTMRRRSSTSAGGWPPRSGSGLPRHAVGSAARRSSPVRRSCSRVPSVSSSPRSMPRWSRTRDRSGHRACRAVHPSALLFTIVYEILGSATESDDVLQDSYLRWAEVDLATVRDTKSYLAQLVTRQALNALQSGRASSSRSTSGRGCRSRCCSTMRCVDGCRTRRVGFNGHACASRDAQPR